MFDASAIANVLHLFYGFLHHCLRLLHRTQFRRRVSYRSVALAASCSGERVIIKWNGGKLHGNISRNGYGNAIIGRYDSCFEEGIWWVYGSGKSCAALERG